MASFAKISEENEVIQVLALDDVDCQNESNVETESVGQYTRGNLCCRCVRCRRRCSRRRRR